jgi:hypothetical protein
VEDLLCRALRFATAIPDIAGFFVIESGRAPAALTFSLQCSMKR